VGLREGLSALDGTTTEIAPRQLDRTVENPKRCESSMRVHHKFTQQYIPKKVKHEFTKDIFSVGYSIIGNPSLEIHPLIKQMKTYLFSDSNSMFFHYKK
jgi:hypothetical protein